MYICSNIACSRRSRCSSIDLVGMRWISADVAAIWLFSSPSRACNWASSARPACGIFCVRSSRDALLQLLHLPELVGVDLLLSAEILLLGDQFVDEDGQVPRTGLREKAGMALIASGVAWPARSAFDNASEILAHVARLDALLIELLEDRVRVSARPGLMTVASEGRVIVLVRNPSSRSSASFRRSPA